MPPSAQRLSPPWCLGWKELHARFNRFPWDRRNLFIQSESALLTVMDQYLFSDEAGDFTFNRQPNVSRFFIICTVATSSLQLGARLSELRHNLLREGVPVGDCFHATSDTQQVRDRVYAVLAASDFTFQATICEKSKAQPQVRESKARFYKYPWYYHFKFGLAPHLN